MWSSKTLLILCMLVAFDEVRTNLNTVPWFGGARDSEGDVYSNPLFQPGITVPSRQTESPNLDRIRSKRDAVNQQSYTIELLVAVDQTMKEHYKDKLEEHVLGLISSASKLFVHKSIGNPIDLAVVNIVEVNLNAEKRNGIKK